jgi:hypothetical protein
MDEIDIMIKRRRKGVDQGPGLNLWHYTVQTDSGAYGSWTATEGFTSIGAVLKSIEKYLTFK